MYKLLFNISKQNIYVIFTSVYNSLISVMSYKIYNEPPEEGTAAKTLKSMIFYNVCNMME